MTKKPVVVVDSDAEIVEMVEDEGTRPHNTISKSSSSNGELIRLYEATEFKVIQERSDFLLHQILDFVEKKRWINLTPEYQRRKRWDQKKKSRLIESLLMNLPIPPVFLYEFAPARYEVMDGQQRLNAIIEFYKGELTLVGLETWVGLNGRTYKKLPSRIKRGLDRRKVTAVTLSTDNSPSEGLPIAEIRREVFERLNTGGEKLNAQELRNCLYAGDLNRLAIELSREDLFCSVWQIPRYSDFERSRPSVIEPRKSNRLYRTMVDTQIVLRYFAFCDYPNLKGSVRSILDNFMDTNSSPSAGRIKEMKSEFLAALNLAHSIFGKETFRLPAVRGGKLSIPLYDAIMVAFRDFAADSKRMLKAKKKIASSVAAALNRKPSYEILIGRPNTASAIEARINSVRKIIKAAIK